MSKDKFKCPNCGHNTLILTYTDCHHCGGGEVLECKNCWLRIDKITKEEI